MKKIHLSMLLAGVLAILGATRDSLAVYHPGAGRFLQRDRVGYVDGASLYQYVQSDPTVKTDAMGEAGRPPAPPPPKPSVAFVPSITKVPAAGATQLNKCGGAVFFISWGIPAAAGTDRGYVIQSVTFKFDIKRCNGKPHSKMKDKFVKTYNNKPYYEAWSFNNRAITQPSWPNGSDDRFQWNGAGDCTKGKVEVIGEAKGWTNYTLPGNFAVGGAGTAPGGLKATWTKPAVWDAATGVAHTMTIEWDCCKTAKGGVKTETAITTNPP